MQVHILAFVANPLVVIVKMFDLKKLEPYLLLPDSNVCFKNGKPDYFGKKIELTVQMTNKCNCGCTFCSNSNFKDYDFDKEKFKEMFQVLKHNYIIAKVAFTGGEPTLHPDLVEIVDYVRNNLTKSEIVINTNASNIDVLEELAVYNPEFGISRHHYNDENNWQIFRSKKPASAEQLSRLVNYDVLLHCNLIKGQIDNVQECVKYIAWCKEMGFKRVGFVELMPYTEAAKNDKAQIDLLQFPPEKTIITRYGERKDVCKCLNIQYDGIGIYTRRMCTINCRNIPNAPLVYNYNRLSKGFGGDIIWD